MKQRIEWLWALVFGAGGFVVGIALVVALRLTHSQFALYMLFTWDKLAVPVAAYITSFFYPDDVATRFGLTVEAFFEALMVLGAGLQSAMVGFLIGLVMKRTPWARAAIKTESKTKSVISR